MKTIKLFTIAVFASLLFVTASMAQSSTTGNIEGVVTDTAGAVVPNVAVSLIGANMIGGSKTVQTTQDGVYQFYQVPPGRYTLSVAQTGGFAAFRDENVEVNLSRTTSVNISLLAQGASANVDVVAGATIDHTQNTTGTNVSADQFSNFPTQRTVQSLYSIAPTVARSGLRDASGRDRDPSVAGSSGPENNYILDGVTTTDPAFGGAGANLPFEFVQEVEVKTGAFGAEYGKATGGIFNVITKSGTNEFHGDVFGYFTPTSFVRDVKASAIPFTGAVSSSFSEIDAGFDIGGPIAKDKLWFFAAFNPQKRKNQFLTQTFLTPVENELTTPFYAGKLTWGINADHTFTFSTFGDSTTQKGFLFLPNARLPSTGFGTSPDLFTGEVKTGGSNYTGRLNSNFNNKLIGEFMFGLHFQDADTIPAASVANQRLVLDNFAVRSGNTVRPVTNTTVVFSGQQLAFVDGRGAGNTLERNYQRSGFGLVSNQNRDRVEGAARMQGNWGRNTVKFGFELTQNRYGITTTSSGPAGVYTDTGALETGQPFPVTTMPGGVRVTNNFGVCTAINATTAECPSAATQGRLQAIVTAGQGPTGITTVNLNSSLTAAQLSTNSILVATSYRARDFFLNTGAGRTSTWQQSFYIQDDFRVNRDLLISAGARWDYQQAYGTDSIYLKLNRFWDNLQPRIGFTWDFTGQGKGKVFANFARYLETPIPLDINVRAGGDDIQLDRNANVSQLNGPNGANLVAATVAGLGCLGCTATPIDHMLKPQTVNEVTSGIEYEIVRDLALGFRGIYRAQDHVIEDGSFDDGHTYFLFNPGRRGTNDDKTTEDLACDGDPSHGVAATGCFGRARRYYRALEFTATKRFSNNYQFIASYVFSSLIGNYEGLFRNDNGQTDPNITSLFDLPSLLGNTYGRLPNDRPHQFKFNGSYRTPFKMMISGNFYMQSGIPFNQLIPHPVYGNNEGFGLPRGTAPVPGSGGTRTPTTHQLDVGLYMPISVGEGREFRIMFDVFNVTNQQKPLRLDETFSINSGISGAQAIQFVNPFYGTGTVFQFPTTMRIGAKFSF